MVKGDFADVTKSNVLRWEIVLHYLTGGSDSIVDVMIDARGLKLLMLLALKLEEGSMSQGMQVASKSGEDK